MFLCYGALRGCGLWERCFRGSRGGGTAGLLSLLPRAAVAAGTEVLGDRFAGLCGHRDARGRARALWDIPNAVCWGMKPSVPAPSRGRVGNGGAGSAMAPLCRAEIPAQDMEQGEDKGGGSSSTSTLVIFF